MKNRTPDILDDEDMSHAAEYPFSVGTEARGLHMCRNPRKMQAIRKRSLVNERPRYVVVVTFSFVMFSPQCEVRRESAMGTVIYYCGINQHMVETGMSIR
jgi:hypothetical protein